MYIDSVDCIPEVWAYCWTDWYYLLMPYSFILVPQLVFFLRSAIVTDTRVGGEEAF